MDLFLGWVVVVLPTLGSLGLALLDENVRKDRRLQWSLVAFGLIVSSLTWFQMSRAGKQANADRREAIMGTAIETANRVNGTIRENVLAALVDYNKANPQHPISDNHVADYITSRIVSGVISRTEPTAALTSNSLSNAALSDSAKGSAIKLRDAAQQWRSDDHNRYMAITDPAWGSGGTEEKRQAADELWSATKQNITHDHLRSAKEAIQSANGYRLEILKRLPSARKEVLQDQSADLLFQKLLNSDNGLTPEDLEAVLHILIR